MKRYILHIFIFIAALLAADVAWGAISASSTKWTATTIDKNKTITFSSDNTSTISISGVVTIKNGCTLTINLASDYPSDKNKLIKASNSEGFPRMFHVEKGGKLVIKGNSSSSRIILDGGARFDGGTNDYRLVTITNGQPVVHKCTTEKKHITKELIRSTVGTLTLDWVTLRNVYTSDVANGRTEDDEYGGAICLHGTGADGNQSGKITGTTKYLTNISNCIIQNCADVSGAAISIRTNNQENPLDMYAANSKVTVTNTTIQYCYSQGSSGGTIRTNGRTISDLELNNVTIQHNYTKGSGGAIYWNAGGTDATDLLINNCTFKNNVAGNNGGAINVATNISFKGKNNITGNFAENGRGGGINIHSYTGETMPKRTEYDFSYTLPTDLIISGNKAKQGAGIAYNVGNFELYKDWNATDDTHKNVTINIALNLNGASIQSNNSTGDGAGIWLANNVATEGTSIGKAKVTIKVNLNSGAINENIASAGNGAGVYLYKTDITHTSTGGTLAISGNKATGSSKNGGAIYINQGTTIDLDGVNATISENEATNGGGIYINSSSGVQVTLGNSTIESNIAKTSGGALYINGGSLTMAKVDINSNTSANNGGAIYVNGGNLTITGDNSTFSNNSVTGSSANGGMAYVSGNLNVNGTSTMTSNVATGLGGAVYLASGALAIADNKTLTVTGNSAMSGGAIYLLKGSVSGAKATINAGATNKATENGGAIYLADGNFTINNCSFTNNQANVGGGLYMAKGTFTANGTVNIDGNKATASNGGGIYCAGSFIAKGNSTINANTAKGNGGALYVEDGSVSIADNTFTSNNATNGGAVCLIGGTLTATGASTIRNNWSTADGGAYYVSDGSVEMTSAEISGNGKDGSTVKTQNGGAIFVTGTGAGFTASGETVISSNASSGKGGAVCVTGGNVSLKKNTISTNTALKGGAVYVENGGFSAEGNTEMTSNSASQDGGAVYVQGGNINITGASSVMTLSGNNAANGGAFYVNGGGIDAGNIASAAIKGNYSTTEGGAFYVNNGNITLCKTELSGNGKLGAETKTTNGGAIALYNGVFSFADGSEIKNNAATGNGGALYVKNSSATKNTIRCTGGSYLANSAGNGGGIYASGNIVLTFAADVRDNVAKNGGGIYLADGITMQFGINTDGKKLSGLIVGNEAKGEGPDGVGGGIYLEKGTLSFAKFDDADGIGLGIYNNAASYEAADIYGSGSETTINLPYVKGLDLSGFDVPGSELYWVNDFHENRYEAALRNINSNIEEMILTFDEPEIENKLKTIKNKKTCLDLGYDLVFVTFTAVNLEDGMDAAAVNLLYPDTRVYNQDGAITSLSNPTVYRKILFIGEESITVGLPSGYWQFNPTSWAFDCDKPAFKLVGGEDFASEHKFKDSTTGADNGAYFLHIKRGQNQEINVEFTKKTSTSDTGKNWEALAKYHTVKVNKMVPGGGSM